MNALEIIEKLKEVASTSEFWYEDLDEEIFGKNKIVGKKGGYEGGGEDAHRVVYFTDHDVYIKLEGTYSSYGGMDIEDSDYKEVRPTERLVTFYE